jgi:HEAT repeat protein
LSTGDQASSIIGTSIAIIAFVLSLRAGRGESRAPGTPRWRRWVVLAVALVAFAFLIQLVPGVRAGAGVFVGVAFIGAAASAAAYGWRLRRRAGTPPPSLMLLAQAQVTDGGRHRYRFFGGTPPTLVDVYVRRRVQRTGSGRVEATAALRIEEVLGAGGHVLLVGGPGAGKSAMVARTVADSALALSDGRAGTPACSYAVAVHAADLIDQQLADAVAACCKRDLNIDVEPDLFAAEPLPGGRWRVLVDGLDEILDASARAVVLGKLQVLIREPPRAHEFLITTRPLAADEMSVLRSTGIDEYDLRPFDGDDLARFAERWFATRRPQHEREAARAQTAMFLARIAGARLSIVTRIPLLANIAAIVFETTRDGELPTSRAALYEQFITHLLHCRQEQEQAREEAQAALRGHGGPGDRLASWLTTDYNQTVDGMLDHLGDLYLRQPDTDLLHAAGAYLATKTAEDLVAILPDGTRLLRDLLLAAGVFDTRGDRLEFIHQSYAEFLASRHRAADFDIDDWRRQAIDPATRGIAAFAAARRTDSDSLIACLMTGSPPDPLAAGLLIADGVTSSRATRDDVLDALVTELRCESPVAPQCLTVLRELAVEADVLDRLHTLAASAQASPWTRAVVADAVAEVDRVRGVSLLRAVIADADETTDDAVRQWAIDALQRHHADIGPTEWVARRRRGGQPHGPIGSMARDALARMARDQQRGEDDRIEAAIRLSANGDADALRAIVNAADVNPAIRLRAASVIAARHGDRHPLMQMARRGTLATRYAAAVELHRLHDPVATDLLLAMIADGRGLPLSYGAAARLAAVGDHSHLADLAAAVDIPMPIAEAAARELAQTADADTLDRVLAASSLLRVRAWMLVGLLRHRGAGVAPQVHALLDDRRLRWAGVQSTLRRIELTAALAATGDDRACARLRRTATWHSSRWVRRNALVALAALGDTAAIQSLRNIAAARWRSPRRRVSAAVHLARLNPGMGTPELTELGESHRRSALRLAAATALAYSFDQRAPLTALILDQSVPTRFRTRALEHARNAGRRHTAAVQTEDRITSSAARRLFGRDIDPEYPPLPDDQRESVAELARRDDTPPRLRIVAAIVALSPSEAGDVLTTIASSAHTTAATRATAATRLTEIDAARGLAAQRAIINDRRIPRPLRWIVLASSDLLDLSEFATHRASLRVLENANYTSLARFALLSLREPAPPPT